METIRIETKVDFKSYVKVCFSLNHKIPFMIIFALIGAFLLEILITVTFITKEIPLSIASYIMFLVSLMAIFHWPLVTFLFLKRQYSTNHKLQERIVYNFADDSIAEEGKSFQSTMSWDYVYKIVEFKNWILIYVDNISAHIIPKSAFSTEQLEQFKTLVKSKPNLKSNLK